MGLLESRSRPGHSRRPRPVHRKAKWIRSEIRGQSSHECVVPFTPGVAARPTHKPFFDGFLIDDAGNIWARRFPSTGLGIQDLRPPRDPTRPEIWTVLDSAGVWLGPVHLPDGFAAREVANDRVYGVHTSPIGTQTVRVYRLVRED